MSHERRYPSLVTLFFCVCLHSHLVLILGQDDHTIGNIVIFTASSSPSMVTPTPVASVRANNNEYRSEDRYYSRVRGRTGRSSGPVVSNQLHRLPPSPANLLKPDGFQFYTYNERGDMITKQMTVEEIQALIASGGPDHSSIEIQEPQKAEDILAGGKKVMDVVEKVQSVLKSALGKPSTLKGSMPTVPDQANAEWSNILPAILAGDKPDEFVPSYVQSTTRSTTASGFDDSSIESAATVQTDTWHEPQETSVTRNISQTSSHDEVNADTIESTTTTISDVTEELDSEKPMIPVPVITAQQHEGQSNAGPIAHIPLFHNFNGIAQHSANASSNVPNNVINISDSTGNKRVSINSTAGILVPLQITEVGKLTVTRPLDPPLEETTITPPTPTPTPTPLLSSELPITFSPTTATTITTTSTSFTPSPLVISPSTKEDATTTTTTTTQPPKAEEDITERDDTIAIHVNRTGANDTQGSTGASNGDIRVDGETTTVSRADTTAEPVVQDPALPNTDFVPPSSASPPFNSDSPYSNSIAAIEDMLKTISIEAITLPLTESLVLPDHSNNFSSNTLASGLIAGFGSNITTGDRTRNETTDSLSFSNVNQLFDRRVETSTAVEQEFTRDDNTLLPESTDKQRPSSWLSIELTPAYMQTTLPPQPLRATLESIPLSSPTPTPAPPPPPPPSPSPSPSPSPRPTTTTTIVTTTTTTTTTTTAADSIPLEQTQFLSSSKKNNTSGTIKWQGADKEDTSPTGSGTNETWISSTITTTLYFAVPTNPTEEGVEQSAGDSITTKDLPSKTVKDNHENRRNDSSAPITITLLHDIVKSDFSSENHTVMGISVDESTRFTNETEDTGKHPLEEEKGGDSSVEDDSNNWQLVALRETLPYTSTTPTPTPTPTLVSPSHRLPVSSAGPTSGDAAGSAVPLDASKSAAGLDGSSRKTSSDILEFSRLCNRLAFRFWMAANKGLSTARSLALSPFGMISLLAMIFLGARGSTSDQMNEVLGLDNVATFNPHLIFQNVTDAVSLALARQQGIANAAFVRELFADKAKVRKLMPFYKEQAQQFYEGLVTEVNFATISDLARRRTNLLIRKQTGGRIKDFVKSNAVPLRSPLAAISANVFQTDCNSSMASATGRDGELYFAVSAAPVSQPLPLSRRKLVPVPATVWRSTVLAGYEPSLDATAVALGGADKLISTIFLLPGQQGHVAPGDTLDRLEQRLLKSVFESDSSVRGDHRQHQHHHHHHHRESAWDKLLRVLIPRSGLELQVPKFSHRSVVNATAALKRMGLDQLFSGGADFKGINGIGNHLFLSDVLQINLFGTCGDENISNGRHHVEVYPASLSSRLTRRTRRSEHVARQHLSSREKRNSRGSGMSERAEDRPRLKLDQPFLYFVRHNPTGLLLHMGRFNPTLLS